MTTHRLDVLTIDSALEEAMNRVRSALRASQFATAARESLEILQAQPSFVPALLALAIAVQLADDQPTLDDFSLNDARAALEKASRLQAEATDAEHELVRFLYAVDNNSQAAVKVVERAIESRTAQLRDLLLARVEVLQDLGRAAEAKRAQQNALKMFPDDANLRAALPRERAARKR